MSSALRSNCKLPSTRTLTLIVGYKKTIDSLPNRLWLGQAERRNRRRNSEDKRCAVGRIEILYGR